MLLSTEHTDGLVQVKIPTSYQNLLHLLRLHLSLFQLVRSLAIIQSLQDVNKRSMAAKLQENLSKDIIMFNVKHFGEVHKGHEQVWFLFLTLFLQLEIISTDNI